MASRRPCSLFEVKKATTSLNISLLEAWELKEMIDSNNAVLFDGRSAKQHAKGHICGAHSAMALKDEHGSYTQSLNKFPYLNKMSKVVVYDDSSIALSTCSNQMVPLMKALIDQNYRVFLLKGGFRAFENAFPELCRSSQSPFRVLSPDSYHASNSLPLPANMSFSKTQFLRLDPYPSCLLPRSASIHAMTPDSPEMFAFRPSNILEHIFIGSESDAHDAEFIKVNNITHIVNVTHHIPFPDIPHLRKKRLAANDSVCEDLKRHFGEGSEFIESAKAAGGAVLVHCQAGISRSPTIVMAYLMKYKKMSFDTAYKLLSERRPVVAPNFNFLAQLTQYSKELLQGSIPEDEDEMDHDTIPHVEPGVDNFCSSGEYEEPIRKLQSAEFASSASNKMEQDPRPATLEKRRSPKLRSADRKPRIS